LVVSGRRLIGQLFLRAGLRFAGARPFLKTIHLRHAQANLPGEKVATDSRDQLGQPPLFLGAALPLRGLAKEADIEHAFR
jgi:hypothetical protein